MLDANSPVPLYYQLKAYIEGKISSGEWKPGDQIPSENELVDYFHVSRTTVRQAYSDLVNQGLLTRAHGRGTFVAQPRIAQQLSQLTSFVEDIRLRGQQPGSRLLRCEVVAAPSQVAQALRLPGKQQVILLSRLRLADGMPVAVQTAYLRYDLCAKILDEDLSQHSLYDLLSHICGVIPAHARQQMEALPCPAAEARLLEMPRGSAVLHIYRTTYDQNETAFEQVESWYRGDRYVFYAELRNQWSTD